jgi:hypothetical protein
MSDFSVTTSTQSPELETAMKVIYQWDYDPSVEELRRLYVKAAEAQWIAERDIDWERPIDHAKFSTTPMGGPFPIDKTSYWRSLDAETTWELTRRTAAFRLSQFLHGEQGALMVAAQLVNAVPHTDAKFYAATQTMDEARHVEVFARYIKKLDEVRPIAPPLRRILDATLQTDDWMKKLVGMQIVVEGLALYAFREMRNLTEEPLLKDLLTYVARDESRHHAYGVQYVSRCVPSLSDGQKTELEDFALEAARSLIDQRNQQTFLTTVMQIWAEAGVDPVELLTSVQKEREDLMRGQQRRRLGPTQGFVIPTLRRCGLFSERIAKRYHELLRDNFSGRLVGDTVEDFLKSLPDLPEDTAAWVLGELQ